MFGMTPMTAWELEADRRRELAAAPRAPKRRPLSVRRDGPEAADRRLLVGWRPARFKQWDDART